MKAIETIYKGHRFRSRLEARWAVVFDTLGIEWQYEPQGYECGVRLTKSLWWEEYPRINYLPDFWLPGEGVFVEVKGEFTSEEKLIRFLDCAAYLSLGETQFGYTEDAVGARPVVVLGPRMTYGVQLVMIKGTMITQAWMPWDSGHRAELVDEFATDGTQIDGSVFGHTGSLESRERLTWRMAADHLLHAGNEWEKFAGLHPALLAGRQARFEHGETGRR